MQWEIALNILEIWRYPVKTLAGEKLSRVCLGPLGLEGDRLVHVEDASGRARACILAQWLLVSRSGDSAAS